MATLAPAIFGYDIFISYSRKDSLDYAYAIAQYFMDKGFECYIDQLSSVTPGKDLPPNIKQAVKISTAFVLIGSEGARESEPIRDEISLFLSNRKNNPLIPITINGAINEQAIWYDQIFGLALVEEEQAYLEQGKPSPKVLERISNALIFTKKGTRLRRIALAALVAILVFLGIIGWQVNKTSQVNNNLQAAQDSLLKSSKDLEDIGHQNGLLQEQIETGKSELLTLDSVRSEQERDLEEARSNIFRLGRETDQSFYLAQASKYLETDPLRSLGFLQKASTYGKDPRLLSIMLDLMDNTPLPILTRQLGKKIQHIEVAPDQQKAAAITRDTLYLIEILSQNIEAIPLLFKDRSRYPTLQFFSDGKIIVEQQYPWLIDTQNGKQYQLDSFPDIRRRYYSRDSEVYMGTGLGGKAYRVNTSSADMESVNDSIGMDDFEEFAYSNSGQFFVVLHDDSTYIFDKNYKLYDKIRPLYNPKFTNSDQFLLGTDLRDEKRLFVYMLATKELEHGMPWDGSDWERLEVYKDEENVFFQQIGSYRKYWQVVLLRIGVWK